MSRGIPYRLGVDQERVREIIRLMLSASEVEAKSELLAQVDHLEAAGSVTWMKLSVAPGAPVALVRSSPVPGTCWAFDEKDQPIGTLVLWTTEGWLSDLEFGWVTDEPPTALPDLVQIRCT
jgi:hypothetical protein